VRHLVLGVISALAAFALSSSSGCGTAAIGVDACRDVELARCDAAKYCGTVDDVASCRRFYRDHCLHGLKDGTKEPTDDQVKDCVAAIKEAGECAKKGAHTPLEECRPKISSDRGATEACDLILAPEYNDDCTWLGPKGDLPKHPGAGGQGGEGGG
jgi:hypothetical protein